MVRATARLPALQEDSGQGQVKVMVTISVLEHGRWVDRTLTIAYPAKDQRAMWLEAFPKMLDKALAGIADEPVEEEGEE